MSNPYQPDPYGGYGQQPYPQPQPAYGPPQQQPGYGQLHPHPPVVAPTNSAATTSVVIGFAAVLLSCVYIGGVAGLVGLGFGVSGLNRSARSGIGRSAAIGGIALNTLSVLISIAVGVLVLTTGTS